ncbi:MAG: hypothetical protein EBU80_13110, partial [Chitinophagia bacterium]|nr:hypothetical protein [Chitinophagia bacterium]
MPGRDTAKHRFAVVAIFIMVCSSFLNLLQAQSGNQLSSRTSTNIPSAIPNTFMVRASSSWMKSVLSTPAFAELSKNLKCQDEAFGLSRFIGKESSLIALRNVAIAEGVSFQYQAEHYIQRRSLKPNDPLLTDQQYLDVIQMPMAWEQGLSGVNRYGDTLVVAVVD